MAAPRPHYLPPDPATHAGIIPNNLNRDPKGVNSKVVIDLNHCINEKQRAMLEADNARNALSLCEKEGSELRIEGEKCRLELHLLTSQVEHLKQENEMLTLKLRHAENKDDSCSQRMADHQKQADQRVRTVLDNRAVNEGASYMVPEGSMGATPAAAQLRERWESTLQRLEAQLLEADKDAEGLRAQKRTLEHTILDLSHQLIVARRSSSRSPSPSLSPTEGHEGDNRSAQEREEDEALTKHQLKEASKSLLGDAQTAEEQAVPFHERTSDEAHEQHRKREEELLWKVRSDAALQKKQQVEAEQRLQRLKQLAEGEIEHEEPIPDK